MKAEEAAEAESIEVDTAEEEQVPPKVQRDAWERALENREEGGSLPTGEQIAARFQRMERWWRLIKQWGQQGRFGQPSVLTPTVWKRISCSIQPGPIPVKGVKPQVD